MDKKIVFVVYKTNENACAELFNSIKSLIIPKDFKIEVLTQTDIGEVKNICEFYNKVSEQNDGKYKIYLNENIIIQNKNMLNEILDVFNSDKKIGIIGISGAKELSTHGISINSAKRAGKIYAGEQKNLMEWEKIDGKYVEAEIADGCFVATQFDIPWRDDLFNDELFSASAECVEFQRKGYKTIIVNQDTPWIWIKTNNLNTTANNKKAFLDEYSKDLFPSCLILIPTYNRPRFLPVALESALNQTYRNIEIIISDDSSNDESENLIKPYLEKYSNIKYYHHKNFNRDDNWGFLRKYQMEDTKSEYVNWLLDDDVFYPTKLEKMIEVYRTNPDVSIVTSSKDVINPEGKIIQHHNPLKMVLNQETAPSIKIDGDSAGKLLFEHDDYIGTLVTICMKKEFLRNGDICWNDDESGCFGIADVSTHLLLLSKGNLFWIDEPLSCHRVHEDSASVDAITWHYVVNDWAKEIRAAWDKKIFLKTKEDLRAMMVIWFSKATTQFGIAHKNGYRGKEITDLEKTFAEMAVMFRDN